MTLVVMIHFNVVQITSLLLLNTILCYDIQIGHEEEKFKNLCLRITDLVRALYGAPPLEWDDQLAERANALASYLNLVKKLKHGDSTEDGENLYASEDPHDIDSICLYAIRAWFKERKYVDFNNPKYSAKTGHFTQLIWKSTKRVGMAESGSAIAHFYIVAKFHPQGNTDGGFKANLQPKRTLNINCVNQFANAEELRILFKFENADTFSQFFHNTTEPCNFNRTIEKLKRKNEEKEGAAGTQGQPGNQGGIGGGNGTQISAAKPAARRRPVQLVFVPIPEPTGNVQQSPISIAPPSGVVAPVQQPVASAGPVPSNTLQSNAGSPGISSTSSKATPTAQTAMNPVRATNSFDPTPGKRTQLFKKSESFWKRRKLKKQRKLSAF